jgi:hypothetical protein
MEEENRFPRWAGIALVALVIVIVAIIITASVMQRPAPPGTAIVGQALPEDHPPGPCYQCHEGMSTGQEIDGRKLPEDHPTERCSQCHEGATQPATVEPGVPGSPPEETPGSTGSVPYPESQ